MNVADDLHVLFGQPLARVHHKEADVRAADRVEGAEHGIVFHVVLHRTLAADARRIDDGVRIPALLEAGIHGVARRARKRRDDGALLPQNFIDERAFARVGFAHDGDL